MTFYKKDLPPVVVFSLWFLIWFFLGLGIYLSGAERIDLKLSPAVCFAPCTVQADVVIPQHPDNRKAGIVVNGPDYYRSSEVQLEGDKAPKRFVFGYSNIPAGEYEVTAYLFDNGNREIAQQKRTLIVTEGGE